MTQNRFSTSAVATDNEYIDTRQPTAEKVFLSKMSNIEREANLSQTPFCGGCAWAEFHKRKTMKNFELESEGMAVLSDEHPAFIEIANDIDLSKFLGNKAFKKISENPRIIQKVLPGGKTEGVIGEYHVEYVCRRIPTHRCTICIPADEYVSSKDTPQKKEEE